MNKHYVVIALWSVFLFLAVAIVVFAPSLGVKMFAGFGAVFMAIALYESIEKLQR